MSDKFLDISINSRESFLKALDFIHDGSVEDDQIIYHEAEHTLDIFIERHYFEDEKVVEVKRIFFFLKKYTYPIIKSQLHLSNVISFKEELKSNYFLKIHTFNECRINNNIYILIFCEALKIKLVFNVEPYGFLKDLEFVNNKKIHALQLSK